MKFKKLFFSLIILMIIISFTNNTYASSKILRFFGKDKTITELGDEWLKLGRDENYTIMDTNISSEGFQEIAGLLTGIGIFVAIGTGIILGIKFMFLTPEGKAEVSKLLIPYVIGISIIVGALTIWKIAIGILDI